VYLQSEYEVVFHVNSRGLRGPERDYRKPPSVTRVLLLGNSFVEGYTVGKEALVSTVLEARLNASSGSPYEVINGGTHGYGTDQEYLFFLEELVRGGAPHRRGGLDARAHGCTSQRAYAPFSLPVRF
jgi:hypothetical protein